MSTQIERKIFCIGFNKTGTLSLHRFFLALGMDSVHSTQWPHYSKLPSGNHWFRHQCYSDGERSDFVALQRWFPGSLFILNDRDEKAWLYSRVKHVLRHNERILERAAVLGDPKYGWMAKDFFFNAAYAITKWVYERRLYHEQARMYFAHRVDFLDIDVTSADDWEVRLVAFLAKNAFPTMRIYDGSKVLHNVRAMDCIADRAQLQSYLRLVDEILESAG